MKQCVLIVRGGLSPAVLTETVWALAQKRKPPFWPDRVIAVVTASVVSRYREILEGPKGKIAELAHYIGQTSVPKVEVGHTECEDIRCDADAIAFGDQVREVVQRETGNEDMIVHLSLAGGRKTMSFHGGAALTLFGRSQDERILRLLLRWIRTFGWRGRGVAQGAPVSPLLANLYLHPFDRLMAVAGWRVVRYSAAARGP